MRLKLQEFICSQTVITLTAHSNRETRVASYFVVEIQSERAAHEFNDLNKAAEFYNDAVAYWHNKLNKVPTQPTPLDLEHPPKGLQTQTGRAARVLGKCDTVYGATHVVAIQNGPQSTAPDKETIYTTTRDGSIIWDYDKRNGLTLTTGPIKKEGWVNVYEPSKTAKARSYGITHNGADAIFESEEAAITFAENRTRVTTVKITWEE